MLRKIMSTIGKTIGMVVVIAVVAIGSVAAVEGLDAKARSEADQIGMQYCMEHKFTGGYEVVKDGFLQYHVDTHSIAGTDRTAVGVDIEWPWE